MTCRCACTYSLLACSAFSAQPCELRLLHAAIKGGKVTKAGEPRWALHLPLCLFWCIRAS
jgi:hypothetical protein